MSPRVPITSDIRLVRMAQEGSLPSAATFNLARLLEAIRLDQAMRRDQVQKAEVSEAKRGENAESS